MSVSGKIVKNLFVGFADCIAYLQLMQSFSSSCLKTRYVIQNYNKTGSNRKVCLNNEIDN